MKMSKSQKRAFEEIGRHIANSGAESAVADVLFRKFDKIMEDLNRIPGALDAFFASVELHATKAAAAEIATHAMRGDDVDAVVTSLREAIDREKAAAEAARKKKEGSAD